jgi:hypothetical protein
MASRFANLITDCSPQHQAFDAGGLLKPPSAQHKQHKIAKRGSNTRTGPLHSPREFMHELREDWLKRNRYVGTFHWRWMTCSCRASNHLSTLISSAGPARGSFSSICICGTLRLSSFNNNRPCCIQLHHQSTLRFPRLTDTQSFTMSIPAFSDISKSANDVSAPA